MAGIGIRYLEIARHLADLGVVPVLITAGDPAEVPLVPPAVEVRPFERGRLATILNDVDAVLAQGQLANDVVLEVPELPSAIDLYDPWLVENLHYVESLGLAPYRNDHATWVLQLTRGDFFLCSSHEQKLYYAGLLTALGRINPHLVRDDPDLDRLIAAVPFGVPETLPAMQPVLPPRSAGEKRLLFGGLYDWYDPWPVLRALERVDPAWTLYFVTNPNADATPQRLLREVETWCRARGLWETRVRTIAWQPAARRYDLLRDVDAMVATHRPSLETRLSLRTRFLDALAAGCPSIATEGGGMSRLLQEHEAGWVVPPDDPDALACALGEIEADPHARAAGAEHLVAELAWPRVLEPLLRFAREPWRDRHKEAFAFRPTTHAPADAASDRLRRWLRRVVRPRRSA